jgi:EAL domain-containing protein (putative c-di-GMP-specific phosphodiesterase class I)
MWLLSPDKIHNLHELIATGSVPVVFQPIWDVRECRILAYEALARPDPKYGFNGPQDAFDLAERIGCAHELDAICRKGTLAAAGELPVGALLFINVSPQSLDHGRLDPHDFVKAVRAAGLTPQRVVIEITERSISRVDAVIDSAHALQKLGFRLALDDTGSGNSGLEMLSRLPLEFVKIDREVIVKALDDRNARGVLAGIVAIADSTGAYVIAEGIETPEMLDFVCRLPAQAAPSRGIHGVQGFLLRRPSETFPQANETKDIEALLKDALIGAPPTLAA